MFRPGLDSLFPTKIQISKSPNANAIKLQIQNFSSSKERNTTSE